MLRLFRPLLFHITSRKGVEGILDKGEIRPNDGTFPMSFGGPYYGFDPELRPACSTSPRLRIRQCLRHACKWDSFFHHFRPVTIAILLDRSIPIVPNAKAVADTNFTEKFFPRVEVWHAGPISRDFFKGYVVSCSVHPTACRLIPADANPLPQIDEVISEFESRYAEDYAARGQPRSSEAGAFRPRRG